MRRWQPPSRCLSCPTIAFCLIFTPLFLYRICPRRCSEWLASLPDTSDLSAEVTIVLGYGSQSWWPAAPLLGWKFYPFLGWSSSDVRIPSHKTLGRAFPFTLLEPRAKLAHTSFIPLSLSKKKKSNLQILHITFCKYIYIYFLNLKNRNGLPNNYFYFYFFSILKIVLKSEPNM